MPQEWIKAKKCHRDDRSSSECICAKNDDCLTRDTEICWSPVGGHLTGASQVAWSPADPEILYVGIEEWAKVVQLNATTGEVVQVSPPFGTHTTGLSIHSGRQDFGLCRDSNHDLQYHCTGKGGTTEGESMPSGRGMLPCQTDADCRPEEILASYQAVQDPASCEFQAILKQVNQTEREREGQSPSGKVLPSESPGRFKARFDGWIRDRGLKYPYGIQYHDQLGLLVSEGSKLMRYDAKTGNALHTLVDLGGNQQGEEKVPGEISCFHAE